MDSIIKMVLDSDWATLTKVVEQKAASKIKDKIEQKKQEVVARMNEGILAEDEIVPTEAEEEAGDETPAEEPKDD